MQSDRASQILKGISTRLIQALPCNSYVLLYIATDEIEQPTRKVYSRDEFLNIVHGMSRFMKYKQSNGYYPLLNYYFRLISIK